MVGAISQITDYSKLADTAASHLAVKIQDKQTLLETFPVAKRLEKILGFMESEISVLQVEKRIRSRVKRQMEKTQREYYLNEQMKAIQKELGDGEEQKDEAAELEERINKTKLTKEARDKAMLELKKLRQMSPMSAEATVVRNYLDWMLGIPWGKKSKIKKDLARRRRRPSMRIISASTRSRSASSNISPCSSAPTSSRARSFASSVLRASARHRSASRSRKATGREFVRMSLGGVRDEAEIRGHRRTYIGSMPGKIIQSMRKAKTNNPLILLDEIDKMGMDFRGDPSAALAGSARSGAEPHLQRSLPRGRLRSVECDVHHHGEHAEHSASAARPHGGHPHRRLHRG